MATNGKSRVDVLAQQLSELSSEELDQLLRRLAEMPSERRLPLEQALPVSASGLRDIMELEGLGKELWQSIDVDEYLRQERESWGS